MFKSSSLPQDLEKLIKGEKPVSELSASRKKYEELINEKIRNKIIEHIPSYFPEKFPNLFGESNFYCLPEYILWAQICYFGGILGDATLYNTKDNVFVMEDANYDAIFEINPLLDPPQIIAYPNALFPFYKADVNISDLVGTTFLGGRLLGYEDDETYIPLVIVPQYQYRSIFKDLYKFKYPLQANEIEEEKTLTVKDFKGNVIKNASPSYVQRVSSEIVKEQKDFANWFFENKLHVKPESFKIGRKK